MLHFSEFNYTDFERRIFKTRKKKVDYVFESDNILTFDIETSTAFYDGVNLFSYFPNKSDGFWNSLQAFSICYLWQFSFDGTVYYGRELKDFKKILEKLPIDTHFIIFIHNAPYEFQFLSNVLEWESVFAREKRKPIKFTPKKFPNVEFRCSYTLTRLSLDSWGKELGLKKLDTLDYNIMRTPKTILNADELKYASRDCEIVDLGIRKYLEKYKHIVDIPLTQTGEVRKVVKSIMKVNQFTGKKDNSNNKWLIKLIPKDFKAYDLLKRAFAGGYTHANFIYCNMVITADENVIACYDFASSYPSVMVCEKYPSTNFYEAHFDYSLINDYAFLLHLKLTNVKSLTFNHYISYSKCFNITGKVKTDNGRIIEAESIEMIITEMDYDIIKKTYTFNEEILYCEKASKAYLPTPFVNYVLELYEYKTTLKGIDEKADIYLQSKQFINSLYGMCVTDLLQDEVTYNNGNWSVTLKTPEQVNARLDELRTNNKGRTFLAYSWGVWVTAYARHNLWQNIIENDEVIIYCDTDSIKAIQEININKYNESLDEKMKKACDYHGFDFERTRPRDKKGVPHPLGYFERESDCLEFITLGAKRYCYRDADKKELHITISGVNKGAVECLDNDINNFNENMVFDKDHKSVKKNLSIYLDDMPPIIWKKGYYDEYKSYDKFGIALRPTGYSMSMAEEFLELLAIPDKSKLRCLRR